MRTPWILGAVAATLCTTAALGANGGGGNDDAPPLPGLGTARLIEWNCPLVGDEVQEPPPADPFPGALVAEGTRVWYVTTVEPRVIRLTPGYPKSSGMATCDWWDLDPLTVGTGGLRLKPYGSLVYVRGTSDIQRIDTAANRRTRWEDGILSFSDLAVSNGYVFTTGNAFAGLPTLGGIVEDPTIPSSGSPGVVQRLTPGSNGSATAKRWQVNPSVGFVELSGIDVDPMYSNRVYFSEPFENMIGELDTTTSKVRRWDLTGLGVTVTTPRQLDVTYGGVIWVVTRSGHVVKLNTATNEAAAYAIPTAGVNVPVGDPNNNPIGVDADGLVGFTAAGGFTLGFNKIGYLAPGKPLIETTLTPTPATKVFSETVTLTAQPVAVPQITGPARPIVKTALVTETDVNGGTFVEAQTDTAQFNPADCGPQPNTPDDPCTPSTSPWGVASDPKGPAGSYYAAIGGSFLRVAHVSLPVASGGMVAGNGKIDLKDPITGAPAGSGYFTVDASKRTAGAVPKGSLTFYHPNGKVISVVLTTLEFVGNTATIEGTCKAGSGCTTFAATLTDNGWTNDAFRIVRDPLLGLGLGVTQDGPVRSGGVKIYRYE